MAKYKRILLKLSGESLMGDQNFGISAAALKHYTSEIYELAQEGVEVAIVIGGGNIFRGIQTEESVIERAQGDYMGMLATVINGMALQSALENKGIFTRLVSAIEMNRICEPYIRRRVIRHLEKGRVVIFGAGTGNPFFTTDTAAALRGVEIEAQIIFKATRVDGIYSADPEKDLQAVKYDVITFDEVYEKNLKVMDMTAITLCKENKIPIMIFDIHKSGNLVKAANGLNVGTLVVQ